MTNLLRYSNAPQDEHWYLREMAKLAREATGHTKEGQIHANRLERIADLLRAAIDDTAYAVEMRKALEQCATYAGPAGNIAIAALAKNPKGGDGIDALERSAGRGTPAGLDPVSPPPPHDAHLTVAEQAVELAVWEVFDNDDIEFFAQVDGPRETALEEARRYAAQIVVIGNAAIIEEVTRREVERLAPASARTVQEQEKP